MATTTISSREANQDFGSAKRATKSGPVIITDRGKPSHVLLSFAQYTELSSKATNLAEALGMPGGGDIEFDPPRSRELPRIVDFD
jgi:prevent-host-death family protein